MHVLRTAPHILLLKSAHSFGDRTFNFALCLHPKRLHTIKPADGLSGIGRSWGNSRVQLNQAGVAAAG
jgi:hypothetical protein